jgi:predicted nucleic acid-binding protein
VASSDVSYVESRAALARMQTGGRIAPRTARDARRVLDEIWLDLLRIPPDDELLATAAELADEHSLRGYDSIQLASALVVEQAGVSTFVCWDAELAGAAERAGLRTAPLRS